MNKFSLLFLSLFILIFVSAPTITATTYTSTGTHSGTVSNAGAVTGGALWTAGTTWVGGVAPGATDDVVIANGDLVYTGTTSINCASLTVQTGAKVCQQIGITGTGTFTLESGSWWYAAYGSATKLPGGFGTYTIDANSNWVICSNASSTLINALPATYGNLFVYKGGSILSGATTITNINIQGNLTIATGSVSSAVKGTNTKSDVASTIHVGGNVYIISGILSGVDAVVQNTSCTYNIDGNVAVGDASAPNLAVLAPVSGADAGWLRTGTFNIAGNLSYINGAKFEAGTSGSSTNVSESAIINIGGNLTTDATVVTASNTLGTFQVNFVGSGTQTLTLGTPTTQMSFSCNTILGINKPSGNVQLGSDLTIGGHVTLTLTKGNLIATDAYVVTLAGSGAISRPGGTPGYVQTNGTVGLKLNVGSSPVTFPVGSGSYTPVVLTNSGTADDFTVNVQNSIVPSPITMEVVNKQWTITEAGTGANVTVQLQWNSGDQSGSFNINNPVYIGRYNGSDWVGTLATLAGSDPYTATASGFTAFSPFIVGNNPPLPVELSSFTSIINGRNITLNWETKTEKNSNKFEIERSAVGNLNWTVVGSVKASVLSNSPKQYSYSDNKLQSGKYQYRLKMIDNDGSFNYSAVIETEIAVPKDFALSQNYPNPFNPSTKIDYQVPVDAKVIMEVYNIAGQKIFDLVNQDQSAGYYTIDLGSSKLSSGIYIYRLVASDKATGNNFSSIKKMVLLK